MNKSYCRGYHKRDFYLSNIHNHHVDWISQQQIQRAEFERQGEKEAKKQK